MILLDTNVVSEVIKATPSRAVLDWLNERETAALFISTVTIGEIEYGLRILPVGKRRAELTDRFKQFVFQAFEERIRDFDEATARSYGAIMAHRKGIGRPMIVPDGQIAAVARSCGYAIATRNASDFGDCGLSLVNPFHARIPGARSFCVLRCPSYGA